MAFVKFPIAREIVLAEFYRRLQINLSPVSKSVLKDVSQETNLSVALIRQCLIDLIETGNVNQNEYSDEYEITPRGIRHVEKNVEEAGSPTAEYLGIRKAIFADVNDAAKAGIQEDRWEPLKIDRDAPEFQEAAKALEEAVSTVESDNGYAASQPDERDEIVWSLKEGLVAINDKLPSYAQVRAMIIAPLRFLMKKFAETTIGEIAKTALGKILTWLAGL